MKLWKKQIINSLDSEEFLGYCEKPGTEERCIHLNFSEEEQDKQGTKNIGHYCTFFRKRLLHGMCHPLLPILQECYGPVYGPTAILKILKYQSTNPLTGEVYFLCRDKELKHYRTYPKGSTRFGDPIYEVVRKGKSYGNYIDIFGELRKMHGVKVNERLL